MSASDKENLYRAYLHWSVADVKRLTRELWPGGRWTVELVRPDERYCGMTAKRRLGPWGVTISGGNSDGDCSWRCDAVRRCDVKPEVAWEDMPWASERGPTIRCDVSGAIDHSEALFRGACVRFRAAMDAVASGKPLPSRWPALGAAVLNRANQTMIDLWDERLEVYLRAETLYCIHGIDDARYYLAPNMNELSRAQRAFLEARRRSFTPWDKRNA